MGLGSMALLRNPWGIWLEKTQTYWCDDSGVIFAAPLAVAQEQFKYVYPRWRDACLRQIPNDTKTVQIGFFQPTYWQADRRIRCIEVSEALLPDFEAAFAGIGVGVEWEESQLLDEAMDREEFYALLYQLAQLAPVADGEKQGDLRATLRAAVEALRQRTAAPVQREDGTNLRDYLSFLASSPDAYDARQITILDVLMRALQWSPAMVDSLGKVAEGLNEEIQQYIASATKTQ